MIIERERRQASSRNVSRLLTDSVTRNPARTAIVFGDHRMSYAELDAATKARTVLSGDEAERTLGQEGAPYCPRHIQ
jgi:acyl-CoA synthetase (AMP-forming)/AMP-acid ligase II